MIIDVTTTEACKLINRNQQYTHSGCVAELRATEKSRTYDGWMLANSPNEFYIIAAELQGAIDKNSFDSLVKIIFPSNDDNKYNNIRLFRQQLSVLMHGLHAKAISLSSNHSLTSPPPVPLIPART